MSENCLFCKISEGKIPAEIVAQDADLMVFKDITPQAPVHLLIIPRKHIVSLDNATAEDQELLGKMLLKAANIARELNFATNGYRVVINTNNDGGQTVFHLHIHLLGGRQFLFPPG
ncbi:MAG: histidine triad nucleotide-binding protein [Pyrinomonadaceae bacterium]